MKGRANNITNSYHALVTHSNRWSLVISSESNSTLGTSITKNIPTIPAVMLKMGKGSISIVYKKHEY